MRAPARIFIFLLFFCLCGFHFGGGTAWGEKKDIGLSVQPGWLLMRDVPVGQLYDLERRTKIRFEIRNGSDRSRRYSLKADKPDKIGVKVLKGYSGIPDPAWFWFEKKEVLVPANGAEEIKMFVRIPDAEKYCNQKWAVGIDVEGKPETGEGLVLAVSPVFYIETEARADLKEKPAGLLALAPATSIMQNAGIGNGKTAATIMVYNNDSRQHLYKISSIIPSAEPGCQVITPSPGFSWIPEKEWLKPGISALTIGPFEQESITVNLHIPEKTDALNQRREGIVLVESDEGPADFARVQIKVSER